MLVWERTGGAVVQVLRGHEGCVFDVEWSERQSLLVSASDDCTVRTWEYDVTRPAWQPDSDEP